MKLCIITITGSNAIGARYIVSNLKKYGHECHLIHFKLFRSHIVHRQDYKTLAYIKDFIQKYNQDIVYRYTPFGNDYLPFPEEVTEKEIQFLLNIIKKEDYDLIGFSLLSPNIPTAIRLTEKIKEKFPSKPILWGGVQPTLSPEQAIKYADIVFRGEGEEGMVEFCENPKRRDIEGFWFKTPNGVIKNPIRRLIQDLDSLPFPSYGENEYIIDQNEIKYQLMENPYFYRDNYLAISSRGCPFRCSYCVHSKMRALFKGQKYLRRRTVKNFIAELEWITDKYNFEDFPLRFNDEIFAWDIDWVKEFCREYKEKINLPFACYCHIKFSTKEIMEELLDAGLIFPYIGFQSGSKYIIEEIYHRKYYSPEEYISYFNMLREIGYKIYAIDVMIGSEYEREEDLQETLATLTKFPKPYAMHLIHIVKFPNTKLAELPEDKKTHLSENIFYFYAMLYYMCQFSEMPSKYLLQMAKDPVLRKNPQILDKIMQLFARNNRDLYRLWGVDPEGPNRAGANYDKFIPEKRKNVLNKYEKQRQKDIRYRIKSKLKYLLKKYLNKVKSKIQ